VSLAAYSDSDLILLREKRRRRSAVTAASPIFRGAALRAQSNTAPEWMVAGPAETGKTFAALYRLDALLRTTPKSSYALVRKVAADIGPTVLRTYQRVVALSGSGAAAYGGNNPQWYDYPNGARLWIGGMDRPGKVLSGERDGIYVNQAEELTLEDWETLSTRTTGRGAVTDTPMLFGDCNPGPSTHWIINRPSLDVMYSKHEDNPTLYDDAGVITEQGKRSMAVLDALTGVRYKRMRLGLWVAAEGTVYDFDRSVHLIPRRDVTGWRRLLVIDFGYTNPFVAQDWAIDADGRMVLVREIYRTQRTVQEHAPTIREWMRDALYEAIVTDHDAEDRATLEREIGRRTTPAMKAVSPGIQAVEERLKVAGDGRPRLMLMADTVAERDERLADDHKPLSTEQEFELYIWPKDASGKANKEAPVKENDHGMDAMRYAVAHIDKIGAKSRQLVTW
jgi:PBSX family phage terminase large subunit